MIQESDWYAFLSEQLRNSPGGVTLAEVQGWAKKKLSKLAPGLALVRSPEETIRSLETYLDERHVHQTSVLCSGGERGEGAHDYRGGSLA